MQDIHLPRAVEHKVVSLDFATPAVSVRPGPGQARVAVPRSELPAWSTPVVEDIFPTPDELAALQALPSIVEGKSVPGPKSPEVPAALAPYVTSDEFAALLALSPVRAASASGATGGRSLILESRPDGERGGA